MFANNKALANSAQTRADEAYNLASAAGGLKPQLLWTNDAEIGVSGYTATSIEVNIPSNTRFLLFIVCTSTYSNNEPAAQLFYYDGNTTFFGLQGSDLGRWPTRRIVRKAGNVISFENAYEYRNDTSSIENLQLIPYKLYALTY